MKKCLAIVLGFCMLFGSYSICRADDQPSADGGQPTTGDEKTRESYAVGYQFGMNIKAQQVDIDPEVLTAAIRDALAGKEPTVKPEEMKQIMQDLRRKSLVAQERRAKETAEKNAKEGQEFLEANKTKEGVQTLPDGLQYKVLKEGSGPSPKSTDQVTVNYKGRLVDGTEFDSSYSRGEPVAITVRGVIPGWTEALQHMKVGSKWEIFIPSQLGYGDRVFGRIPPGSTLIFEIELLGINDSGKPSGNNPPAQQNKSTDAQKGGKQKSSK